MTLRVGAVQMACSPDRDDNVRRAEALVRQAAGQGARLILLPELFETPYFCKEQDPRHFELARIGLQDAAIELLGFAQLSCLVAPECELEQPVDPLALGWPG